MSPTKNHPNQTRTQSNPKQWRATCFSARHFRYATATNLFGIINQYGGISTFFEPTNGIQYWIEQIIKYAPR